MTQYSNINLERRYQQSPKSVSPPELDEKILNAARDLVPSVKSSKPIGWIPVATTVCVVILTVIIVNPVLQHIDQPDSPSSVGFLEDSEESKRERKVSSSSTSPASQVIETSVIKQKNRKPLGDIAEQPMALEEGAAKFTVSQDSIDQESFSRNFSEELQVNQPKSAALNLKERFSGSSSISGETGELPQRSSLKRGGAQLEYALIHSLIKIQSLIEEERLQEASKALGELAQSELDRLLQEIKKIGQDGDRSKAENMLRELIQHCPQCGLPGSVDDL